MTIYAEIKVDTNDADYISDMFPVNKEELGFLNKIAKVLKDRSPKNGSSSLGRWNNSEYDERPTPDLMYEGHLTLDDVDRFNDMCPWGEHGFHSVASIRIFYVTDKLELPASLLEKKLEALLEDDKPQT